MNLLGGLAGGAAGFLVGGPWGAAAGAGLGLGMSEKKGGGQASSPINDQYAQLTRDQWSNYVSTFIPIENQLIKYATDPAQATQAMQTAHANVESAYTQQQGAVSRELKGMGVSLSPDEQQAQQRQFGLSKSLADVQAQNVAGDLTRQRQQSVLGNPAPTGA